MAGGDGASAAAGFTLIEILVAFTITALTLVALYRMASDGFASEATADRYSQALLFAQSAIEGVGIETPLTPGQRRRRLDDTFDEEVTVRLRRDLMRDTDAGIPPYPYEIAVKIAWHDGKRTRSVDLSTIRLAP